MVNTNARTGLKFGILEAGRARWLLDDIQRQGESVTYRDAQDQLRRQVEAVLGGFDGEGFPGMLPAQRLEARDELFESLLDRIGISHHRSSHARALGALLDLFDLESGTLDIEEAYEAVLEEVREDWQFDEEQYQKLTHDPQDATKITEDLEVSWYGGQQLIWVKESQFCTPCQPGCRMTVWGAGLLDKTQPLDLLGGEILTHCPAPEDWKGWVVIYRIVGDEPDLQHPIYPARHSDDECDCGRRAADKEADSELVAHQVIFDGRSVL